MELHEIYSSPENEQLIMILTAITMAEWNTNASDRTWQDTDLALCNAMYRAEKIFQLVKVRSHEVNE